MKAKSKASSLPLDRRPSEIVQLIQNTEEKRTKRGESRPLDGDQLGQQVARFPYDWEPVANEGSLVDVKCPDLEKGNHQYNTEKGTNLPIFWGGNSPGQGRSPGVGSDVQDAFSLDLLDQIAAKGQDFRSPEEARLIRIL